MLRGSQPERGSTHLVELRYDFTSRVLIPESNSGGVFECERSVPATAADDCTLVTLFVGDRSAGGARKLNHFEALETCFATPFFKIRGGIIEGIAKFDQHV